MAEIKVKVTINPKDFSIDFASFTRLANILIRKVKLQREQIALLEEQTKLIDYWKNKYFEEINKKRGL